MNKKEKTFILKGENIPTFSRNSKDGLFKSKLDFNLIKKMKLPIAYKPEDFAQIIFSDSSFRSIAPKNRRNTILQIKKKKSMEKVYIDFL